jgi:hypothetical protein
MGRILLLSRLEQGDHFSCHLIRVAIIITVAGWSFLQPQITAPQEASGNESGARRCLYTRRAADGPN